MGRAERRRDGARVRSGELALGLSAAELGASAAELLDFYGSLSGRIEAGALLSLISIAMFAVFASAFRGS